jgi:hypothetical protein
LWVNNLLQETDISLEPQSSSILEINDALKSASKKGSDHVGKPDFIGIVKDFIIVIENKSDITHHVKVNDKNLISLQPNNVKDFAINGAIFYGQHLAKNTSYKKIIALGISGNEKRHRII